jgi:Tfp pilus assembly protein PilN
MGECFMMQQINLYSEILKQQQKQSVVTLYLRIVTVVVIVIVAFSAYLLWAVGIAETTLKNEQLVLKNEQAQMNDLAAKNANPAFNTPLVAEIKQLQSSINDTAKTLRLMANRRALSENSFSGYLEALAKQSDNSVWITSIHIAGKNRDLSIQGSTFKPEKVPDMLQHLQKDPVFKGQSFDKLVMEPTPEKPEQINFTLGSYQQPLPEKKHGQ